MVLVLSDTNNVLLNNYSNLLSYACYYNFSLYVSTLSLFFLIQIPYAVFSSGNLSKYIAIHVLYKMHVVSFELSDEPPAPAPLLLLQQFLIALCKQDSSTLYARQLKRSGQALKSCAEESATVASILKIIWIFVRGDRWSHLRSIFESHQSVYDWRELIALRFSRQQCGIYIVLFSAWYLLYNYYLSERERENERLKANFMT